MLKRALDEHRRHVKLGRASVTRTIGNAREPVLFWIAAEMLRELTAAGAQNVHPEDAALLQRRQRGVRMIEADQQQRWIERYGAERVHRRANWLVAVPCSDDCYAGGK